MIEDGRYDKPLFSVECDGQIYMSIKTKQNFRS